MLDLLLTNASILDGTGNPAYAGAVGVEGDRVRILRGDISAVDAGRTIDVSGMIVCPGFIDMHAHSALLVFEDPKHEAKIRQGVTTELIGVDGNSYAPFPDAGAFDQYLTLNSGLEGTPALPSRWSTVGEYLDLLDGQAACNFAYVIGNSALRLAVMGWDSRPANQDELRQMRALIARGMEEGAFGISTGLSYPPGAYASTEELAELCREVARLGGLYVTHVRYTLGDRFLDPFKEAVEIGRRSGAAVHISHFNSPRPGGARRLLPLIDEAAARGQDVTFDSYPYPYTSTRLESALPEWAHEGGLPRLIERMRDPAERQKMADSLEMFAPSWDQALVTNFRKPHNQRCDGLSVADIAAMLNKPVIDAVCDLLLEEELALTYVGLSGNPVNIREFFRHPAHMVGSDAVLLGEHLNPRSYGCFPMVLGEFARDEAALTLPEAVRKMTSFPAQRLGLHDRGILRDGMKADIAVFDPATVRANATLEHPRRYPDGIPYVMVNGTLVIDNGQHTGATPGRALRR